MKYYIQDLPIHKINFIKLQNNLYHESNNKEIILSDNGYFTVYNNHYYHHYLDIENATSETCYYKVKNYLDNYTLYVDNNKWNRKKTLSLPVNHQKINVKEDIYKLNEKCNVSFIVEKTETGDICDVYFLSHLNENDYSFQETLSYLLAKLI